MTGGPVSGTLGPMPKYTEEFWRRVRATYVESWQDGRNLTLDQVARLHDLASPNVKARASREGWANDARIAAAMGKAMADTNTLVAPVVRQEVSEQLASPEVSTAIQRRADQAVEQAVETRVRPMADMMEAHGSLVQQGMEVGEALMALAVDALPVDGEQARRYGWTASEVLRAMELAWKLRESGMKWERTLHGLPTSVRVSQAQVDARHTFQGVGDALDVLGGLSVADLARRLRDQGVDVPEPGVIDAEFTAEEEPSGKVPQPQH